MMNLQLLRKVLRDFKIEMADGNNYFFLSMLYRLFPSRKIITNKAILFF